jgi:hypothetical protein
MGPFVATRQNRLATGGLDTSIPGLDATIAAALALRTPQPLMGEIHKQNAGCIVQPPAHPLSDPAIWHSGVKATQKKEVQLWRCLIKKSCLPKVRPKAAPLS